MKIILDLTTKEIEKLDEALTGYCDEGPEGEGWSSDEFNSMANKIKESIFITDNQIKNGRHKLSCWFGLTYASWLTIPRVMLGNMPDSWQSKLADLLEEYDLTFTNQPDIGTRVQITKDGKLTKAPPWLLNYRRPDCKMLQSMKQNVCKEAEE